MMCIELDAHTMRDLEVFEADPGGSSLYRHLNFCRTEGGAAALRRRLAHSWSNPDRIAATQAAIRFIGEHREVFRLMPTAFATGRLLHYTREALPIVTEENSIEFVLAALSLRADHVRDYHTIVRGVRVATGMIQGLREFLGQETLDRDCGELKAVITEMRGLLARPGLTAVPDGEVRGWVFRIMWRNQAFRVRERSTLARLLQLTGEIDALVAMTDANEHYGYVVRKIETGPLRVEVEALEHPLLERPVANPFRLDQERRVLFLTGPNMAGKTTYLCGRSLPPCIGPVSEWACPRAASASFPPRACSVRCPLATTFTAV